MLLYLLLISMNSAVQAKPNPSIQCPGRTTYEMSWCIGQKWQESNDLLKKELAPKKFKQWEQISREVCAAAYEVNRGGTIYPLMITGCKDKLNRSLLKEFNTWRK